MPLRKQFHTTPLEAYIPAVTIKTRENPPLTQRLPFSSCSAVGFGGGRKKKVSCGTSRRTKVRTFTRKKENGSERRKELRCTKNEIK